MKDEIEPLAPLTQQETEDWIGKVEDSAWEANAEASACRFLLGNLLTELDARGVISAPLFIAGLQRVVKNTDMQDQRARLGIEDLLNDLQLHFAKPKDSGGEGSPSGTFH